MDQWMTHQMMNDISQNLATPYSVEVQVRSGADVNARVQTLFGDVITPLAMSASNGNFRVTETLLNLGADATDIDSEPLNQAVIGGNTDVIDLLISRGSNINMRAGNKGYTPLVTAANKPDDDWRMVRHLLSKGANPNRSASNGLTPLYVAAQHGNIVTMEYLVERNADVNSKTTRGNTPLINAADEGQNKAVKYLIENGADINWRNAKGMSALDHAIKGGYTETARVLREAGAR